VGLKFNEMLSALKVLASGPGFVGITLTELNPHNAASDEWLLDRFAARFAEAVSRLSWLPLTEASLGIGPEKPVGDGRIRTSLSRWGRCI
jgi:hypothetical protein